MAGQGAGQVKRALKPGFLAGIVMNQKQHVLHLRLPRISFRSRGRCWTGMAMRSLRNITRVLNLATSGKSLLSTVSRTAINLQMKRTFLLLLALLLPTDAAAGTPHWNGEQGRQILGRPQSSGSEGIEPAAREAEIGRA